MPDLVKVNTALMSVYDKTGLPKFVEDLFDVNPDIQIISSGGTARKIRKAGYGVTEVSDYTKFPESPGHLVLTLQPQIHGGILLDPHLRGRYRIPGTEETEDHRAYMDQHGIVPIDLVVVNFYPFEDAVAMGADIEAAREKIDIGGPTMVNSAAKAFPRVTTVVKPEDYGRVVGEMQTNGGATSMRMRAELAQKAWWRVAQYRTAIAQHFGSMTPGTMSEFYVSVED